MAKTLIILILLFDGTLIQERYNLTREMSVHECLQYGDDHREAIAEYKEFKNTLKNGILQQKPFLTLVINYLCGRI